MHSALGKANLRTETEPWLPPDEGYCAAGFQMLEGGKEGWDGLGRGRGLAGLQGEARPTDPQAQLLLILREANVMIREGEILSVQSERDFVS